MKHAISSKLLKEKIERYNWAPYHFAEYLECTEEEFWEALRKAFSGNTYTSFEKDLKKNAKQFEKAKKQVIKRVKVVDVNAYSSESTSPHTTETDSLAEVVTTETAIQPTVESIPRTETLDSLKEQYAMCLNALNVIKEQNEDFQIQQSEQTAAMVQKQKELFELKAKIRMLESEISEFNLQLVTLHKQIDSNLASKDECEKQLLDLSNKIELFKKVTIFVYLTGEIEILSKSQVQIPNNWNEIFNEIVTKTELEELTIKQLKALAQVLALKTILIKENRTFEITFENPISEEYFKKAS